MYHIEEEIRKIIPEEKRLEIKKSGKHPAMFLPNCGLNYSLKHLDEMDAKIYLLPIEEQAKYADNWCILNVKDLDFYKNSLPDDIKIKECYQSINSTGVGNMAYCALYAPTQEYRDCYKKALEKYCQLKKFDNQLINKCILF